MLPKIGIFHPPLLPDKTHLTSLACIQIFRKQSVRLPQLQKRQSLQYRLWTQAMNDS